MIYPSQSNLILLRYYSLWHRYDIDPKDKISKYSWKYLQVDRENILLAIPPASSEESWLESRRIPNVQRLYTLRFLDITIIIKIFNHPSRWLFSLFLLFSLFVFVFTVTLQSSFENRLIFYIGIHALIIQRTWR